MNAEVTRITGELQRTYQGPAWHGPSLLEALQDVAAAQAGAHPLPGAHSIYDLTHHVAAWIDEVRSRLLGALPGQPTLGDWPPANLAVDERAWRDVLSQLDTAHTALLETLATFDDARLQQTYPSVDPTAPGMVTFYVLLHGLVQHNAYHAGQMVLLRNALRRGV
jgi:uncharacterized damage-inducible protein DinB